MFFSCNSPSDSNGKIVENSLLYEIDNYCYDVDISFTEFEEKILFELNN